jgi:hypothetical protein
VSRGATLASRVARAASVALVAWLAIAPARAGAQPPPPGVDAALDAARAERGARLAVSVLTFGNGAVLWERFGHNAIVITDEATGESRAYNWGVFDFDQPNFLARFLTGDTRYWLAIWPTRAMFEQYVSEDRTAREQVLAFSPVQRAALQEFVEWQAREENRYYRYDYYLDNCSTRVRDALDRVLDGAIARALSDVPAEPRTWRGETARVTDGDWPPFAGIHVALGRNADQPLTRWHEGFMPERLADHLATIALTGEDDQPVPLVAGDTVRYQARRAPTPDRPPVRLVAALALGLLLSGAVLGLASRRASRAARVAVRLLAVGWYTVGGVIGTLLLLAGTVTKHAPYMGSNASLFQVHPALLVAAVCALLAGRSARLARGLSRLAVLTAGLSVVGLVLQGLALGQRSWLVVAVTVPVHVAFALAFGTPAAPPAPSATTGAAAGTAARRAA